MTHEEKLDHLIVRFIRNRTAELIEAGVPEAHALHRSRIELTNLLLRLFEKHRRV